MSHSCRAGTGARSHAPAAATHRGSPRLYASLPGGRHWVGLLRMGPHGSGTWVSGDSLFSQPLPFSGEDSLLQFLEAVLSGARGRGQPSVLCSLGRTAASSCVFPRQLCLSVRRF